MRVCLFTDTLGDVNGVSRFVRAMAAEAQRTGRDLRVFTSTRFAVPRAANILNFAPRAAAPMPRYDHLELVLPPARAMARALAADRPDVVHVSTPGPVGLVGRLAARRLGVPLVGVYHTDFPAYVEHLFDDAAMAFLAGGVMRWFYRPFAAVLARSEAYAAGLRRMGIGAGRIVPLRPGVDLGAFHVRYRDPDCWRRYPGVRPGSVKVLYVGRLSVEKNLPMLAATWDRVRARAAARGLDAELVLVGDGPHRAELERRLRGRGAHFLGYRHGAELSTLYASADLFVFPSTTDTLGQVVMEALASGLPAVVSDRGGPSQIVRPGRTGLVLPARPALWAEAITALIADAPARRAMGAAAHASMRELGLAESFERFWAVHEGVRGAAAAPARPPARPAAVVA